MSISAPHFRETLLHLLCESAILNGVDVSTLTGAQILVGYGTDDNEMLTTGCYRVIYVVPE